MKRKYANDNTIAGFDFLIGDVNWREYGGSWISHRKFTYEDFNYWYVITFSDGYGVPGKYSCRLSTVSPDEAMKTDGLKSALESCGLEEEIEAAQLENDTEKLYRYYCEALSQTGCEVPFWFGSGNNAYKLLRQARQEVRRCESHLLFYMAGPLNYFGADGWNLIRGIPDPSGMRT